MSDDPCDGCGETKTDIQRVTFSCYIKEEGCADGCPCSNCLVKPICSVPCKEQLDYFVDTHVVSKKRKLEERQHETYVFSH